MANLCTGTIVLDDKGEGIVLLPRRLDQINVEYRYQLTCVGVSAPVYVAEEVCDGRFTIAGGAARMKVCWQVEAVPRPRTPTTRVPQTTAPLTPRAKETLEVLLTGASDKEIAETLGISLHTVHQYVGMLLKAYRANSRVKLVASLLSGRPCEC